MHSFGRSLLKWIIGGMIVGFLYGITHHGVSTINATIGAGIFADYFSTI
ncbi:hypothetical protein [Sporomusa sphaeroides]|nr:hypothetical protein [Sporomusa sphaeroides]MCM0757664.1 hypothetical protein [Sporomusa sphaeroides DSM 2875]HML32322.1 hypothetical protein [Sporomusa sphaeroides]